MMLHSKVGHHISCTVEQKCILSPPIKNSCKQHLFNGVLLWNSQVHSILFVISITMLLWNYFFVRRESKQLRWYSFIFLLVISPRTLNEQNHYGLAVVYYPCNNNNLQNQKKTEKKDRKPFSYWDYTVLPC